VLAGLRFAKDLIGQLFRKETMRESVIYQEIRSDGIEEGRKNEALLIAFLRKMRYTRFPEDRDFQA
jgi:predicted transposase YdaD